MNDADEIKLYKSLIYVSTAAAHVDYEAVMDILTISWRHNHNSDVSGMLIYDDRYFMQLIQGPIATIDRLFDRIAEDPRHHTIRVIDAVLLAAPECYGWSVGFIKNSPITDSLFEQNRVGRGHALYSADYVRARALLKALKNVL